MKYEQRGQPSHKTDFCWRGSEFQRCDLTIYYLNLEIKVKDPQSKSRKYFGRRTKSWDPSVSGLEGGMQGSAKDLYWFWWTMIGPSLCCLYSTQSPRDWMWRILYSAAKRQRFQRLETLTRSDGSTGPVLLWYLINISYQLTSFQLSSTTSSSSITFFSASDDIPLTSSQLKLEVSDSLTILDRTSYIDSTRISDKSSNICWRCSDEYLFQYLIFIFFCMEDVLK